MRILPDEEQLAAAAAEEFVRIAAEAVATRGSFSVALAGGATPRTLYGMLADPAGAFCGKVAWERARIFFGDERSVPPEHPESNYRMAYETLLSKVPLRPGNVVRFHAEGPDPAFVASYYETLMLRAFGLGHGGVPRFDLLLLGMGADAHTLSWFPGSEILRETERLAAAVSVPKLATTRYTLTPPVVDRAAHVIFLVAGASKAESLRQVLEGDHDPERFPAQAVAPRAGVVLWFVDRAAAGLLRRTRAS